MSMSTGTAVGNAMTGSRGMSFNPNLIAGKSRNGYRPLSLQQFTPDQMKLFRSLFGNLGPNSFLSKLAGGDESTFADLEAPDLQNFAGIQGNIASRFSQLQPGAESSRRSSGFQNTMNQAASDFAQQLRSQRLGLQRQALADLFDLSNNLLAQRPYETSLVKHEQRPSFLQSLFGGSVPIAGAVAGGLGAGLGGAKLGSSIGSSFSRGFLG